VGGIVRRGARFGNHAKLAELPCATSDATHVATVVVSGDEIQRVPFVNVGRASNGGSQLVLERGNAVGEDLKKLH